MPSDEYLKSLASVGAAFCLVGIYHMLIDEPIKPFAAVIFGFIVWWLPCIGLGWRAAVAKNNERNGDADP